MLGGTLVGSTLQPLGNGGEPENSDREHWGVGHGTGDEAWDRGFGGVAYLVYVSCAWHMACIACPSCVWYVHGVHCDIACAMDKIRTSQEAHPPSDMRLSTGCAWPCDVCGPGC